MSSSVRFLWSVTAGGLSALPHQNGYSFQWGATVVQSAHVFAIGRKGYQAYVTGLPGGGLWTNLGTFRRSSSARKACRLAIEDKICL